MSDDEDKGFGSHPASVWTVLATTASMMAVLLVIVGGVGVMALGPINEKISNLQHEVEKINLTMTPLLALYAQHDNDLRRYDALDKRVDGKVSLDVFDAQKSMVFESISTLKTDVVRTSDEITHQVHTLEGEIVTRSENEAHWSESSARLVEIQTRLDALVLRLNAMQNSKPISPTAEHASTGPEH